MKKLVALVTSTSLLFTTVFATATPLNTFSDPWYYPGAAGLYVSNYSTPAVVTNSYSWTSPDGKTTIPYDVKTGHLVVNITKNDKPISGTMLYRAYVKSSNSTTKRPITFIYNGGPGAAANYIQVAAFGPSTVKMTLPDQKTASFIDAQDWQANNPNSILNNTDLVYINPIGTSGSSAIFPSKNSDFWSVDSDSQSIANFVDNYLTLTGKKGAPVYLMGESYGTPRSAVAANVIAKQYSYIDLKGVVLISSLLSGTTTTSLSGGLPSAAANAYYNNLVDWKALGKTQATRPTFEDFLAEVTTYSNSVIRPEEVLTSGPRFSSLLLDLISPKAAKSTAISSRLESIATDLTSNKYSNDKTLNALEIASTLVSLQEEAPINRVAAADAATELATIVLKNKLYERAPVPEYSSAIVAKAQAYTGLTTKPNALGGAFWLSTLNAGIVVDGEKTYFGKYDSRIHSTTAPEINSHGSDDASLSSIAPVVFWGSKKIETASGYSSNEADSGEQMNDRVIEMWDWTHLQPDGKTSLGRNTLNTILDLKAAMIAYPSLKVYQTGGYFDSVTPFNATQQAYFYALSPETENANLINRLTIRNFSTGHLTYSTRDVAVTQKQQLDTFYATK